MRSKALVRSKALGLLAALLLMAAGPYDYTRGMLTKQPNQVTSIDFTLANSPLVVNARTSPECDFAPGGLISCRGASSVAGPAINPTTGALLGAGNWGQSQNLFPYSNAFSSWAQNLNISVADGTAPGPTGLLGASVVTPTTTSGLHQVASTVGITGANPYSVWLFVRQNGYSRVYFGFSNGAGTVGVGQTFDVSAGTVVGSPVVTGSPTSYSVIGPTAVGIGYYKIGLTVALGGSYGSGETTASVDNGTGISFAGDGTSGLIFGGAQIEQSVVATPYIPTSGVAVTRAADALQLSSAAFGQAVNPLQGAFFADVFIPALYPSASGVNHTIAVLSDGTANNRYTFQVNQGTTTYQAQVNAGGGATNVQLAGFAAGTLHRIGGIWNGALVGGCIDGGTPSTST
ncbi:MAG: hypothetical protein P4L77_12220, partial [Sulfuriferula sp.]|nr:hypothetical protein [Sulfuriferula sp.]